jgi:hypothetical protein
MASVSAVQLSQTHVVDAVVGGSVVVVWSVVVRSSVMVLMALPLVAGAPPTVGRRRVRSMSPELRFPTDECAGDDFRCRRGSDLT